MISDPKGYIMEGTKFPSLSDDGGGEVSGNAIVAVNANPSYSEGGTTYDWETVDGNGNKRSVTSQFIPRAVSGPPGKDGAPGKDGLNGADGQDGADGRDGADGFSPVITFQPFNGGHQMTVITAGGTQTIDIADGADGADGERGSDGKNGKDGVDGERGADGFSPSISVTDIEGGKRISVIDADGETTFDIMNGNDGRDGVDGTDGITPNISANATVTSAGETGVDVNMTGTTEEPVINFAFRGIGSGGSAEFPIITATASVTPGELADVDVNTTGDDSNKNIDFAFTVVNGKDGKDGAPGPQGERGEKGETGAAGPSGAPGVTPNIGATASAVSGNMGVTVERTGTDEAPVFNFTFSIPGGSGLSGNFESIGTITVSREDPFGSGSYTTEYSGNVSAKKGDTIVVVPSIESNARAQGSALVLFYSMRFDNAAVRQYGDYKFALCGYTVRSASNSSITNGRMQPVQFVCTQDFTISGDDTSRFPFESNIIGSGMMKLRFYKVK